MPCPPSRLLDVALNERAIWTALSHNKYGRGRGRRLLCVCDSWTQFPVYWCWCTERAPQPAAARGLSIVRHAIMLPLPPGTTARRMKGLTGAALPQHTNTHTHTHTHTSRHINDAAIKVSAEFNLGEPGRKEGHSLYSAPTLLPFPSLAFDLVLGPCVPYIETKKGGREREREREQPLIAREIRTMLSMGSKGRSDWLAD